MDITKIILDTLRDRKQEPHRRYIGASSIGKECSRAIWYDYHGIQGTQCPSKLKITFEIGHQLEALVMGYLEEAGLNLERPSKDNVWLACQDDTVPQFQGHMDAVLHLDGLGPVVVEMKTASNSNFNNFKNKGLATWSPGYLAQVQSYMGMSDCKNAVIIVLNKDSSELHHEWVKYDDIFYHELRLKALAISTVDEPPARINKSPLFHVCRRCKFNEVCFND